MLFFLTWLTLIEVLPEDGLLVQTYSTDNIGRQNFFFALGVAGTPFQSLGYKESMILSLKQHEMRIAVPFWIRFFDEYFHFYSLPKMAFSHPFCTFIPQQMRFEPIEVFTVKDAQLYIQNMRIHEVMIINEILTNSKNIFIPQLQIVRVLPGTVVLYSIYICPTEPGTFQDIIFIKTNFGTISYSISYQAYKNQDDTITPVLIHHYAQDEINISIEIPTEIAELKKSVIFDASIFDSSRVLITDKNIFIYSSNIATSSYITFVHILTTKSSYTFPLTILSSPKPLQHIYPIIVIPPIINDSDTSEVDIIIINPTDMPFEITSILLTGAPFNVKLEKMLQPIYSFNNSRTVIGRIVATGEREGEISGSVHVDYISRQSPIKYDMLIPVKGCCFFGTLTFSDNDINLLSNSSKNFSMINNFTVPIVIFEIKPDSPYFSIGDFEPFLLLPGQTSREIPIKFNYSSTEVNCDSIISIVTNITSFHIHVHGLTGKITIHDANNEMSPSNSRRSLLQADLGIRYVKTIQNFTFVIKNPNPVEFVVSKVKSTPGIKIECTKEFVVGADSEYSFQCLVFFRRVSEKKRTDQITFYGTGKSLLVILTWIPVNGSVTVNYSLPEPIYYGYGYIGNFSLYSTFNTTFTIRNIISFIPSKLTTFDLNGQFDLKPNMTTEAGNISFLLDNSFIKSTPFEELLEKEKNYKNFIANWSDGPQKAKIYVMLQYSENLFMAATMKFDLYISHVDDIELNIGKVVIGSYKNTTIAIPNNFHTTAHFTIFDHEDVKFEDTEFPLDSDCIAIVAFLFHGKILGSASSVIPITSNITAPFYARISATVVDIKIQVYPREIYFEPSSLFERVIKKTIYVMNRGTTEIMLNNFTIRPVGWKPKKLPYIIKTNCTVILEANKTCLANIFANSWDLTNASFDFVVQSHMTRKSVRLRSTVGYRIQWRIILTKKLAWNSLLLIALAYPTYLVIKGVIVSAKRKKLLQLKLSELPDEIEKLSATKSLKFSVATQAVGSMDSTGGVWVKSHHEGDVEITVSKDLISAMKSALKKIE